MISVLVTGSNGQLGKCLRDVSINKSNIKWIFKSSKELDITDENSIRKTFENNKIDYLINCAAYTAVDKAESEKDKAFLVNAEGVSFLAKVCKEYDTTLIHMSTDFVFDGKKRTPYTEMDIPNPINVYGVSKFKGEQYVQDILKKYYIIRTSWVYSEYGNNFVKTMLKLTNQKNEISVVNDQIGSPTYAGDLANVILNLITSNTNSYGLYHYSNEGVASWYDFAKAVFEESKIHIELMPIKTQDYQSLAKRPVFSVLDKYKVKNELKTQVPYWKDSLKKAITNIS
ncbi:MAG: dTDP-4-dehydrorhamnose reductase [Flavobacteriales bacterium]